MSALSKLGSLGSKAFGRGDPMVIVASFAEGRALTSLLAERNGFFAFTSALLVRGSGAMRDGVPGSLEQWNTLDGWRADYGDAARGLLFFAEDAFGAQFAISADRAGVCTFDPETAAIEWLAPDLEGWAAMVLADFAFLTGHPLAEQWQKQHGALPHTHRLVPKQPFVMGGAFDVDNLSACEADAGMRSRAAIARQIADLPDGAKVRLVVTLE
jgi:hypothetical protein